MTTIDWRQLEQLQSEVGQDAFQEVVDLFLDEVDEVIARLDAAQPARALEEDLHFLKGSALNLGFKVLSTLCQAGEKRAAQGQTADIDLGEIRAAYQTGRDELVAHSASAF
ncbi:Hpt domain protein [Aquimixticola soesokkakensis]|uniref:Hpt domain protein n=1 Tax=Aquimixticola soesokkakensis TaxID=1519096 RepID=A0A1Y5R840_9RHOB|nr:Hpt domain-containing protein [Aquimixticola soesokkakensis]SLN11299.1 Hpt domain protein [Aquimixticola soesokkakensis]